MRLTPLGTNGFIPTHGRHTMSFLVEEGGRALLLDAGTGLSRLVVPPLREKIQAYGELEILLTHYHLDHVVGLSYLSAFWQKGPVTIHAPAPPLVDGRPEEALGNLLAPPLFPVRLNELAFPVEVRAYDALPIEVAGMEVRGRRQRHGGGSVGLVLAGRLAYLTDCELELEPAAELVAGVELLIHEVWATDAEVAAGAPRHGHSTVEEVAALTRAAGVGRVLPVHHRPDRASAWLAEVCGRLQHLAERRVVLVDEGGTEEV